MSDWATSKIGDVCIAFSGGTPSTSHTEYYGGDINWIVSADLNKGHITTVDGRITELGLKNSAAKMVQPGTPLLALYGATAGVPAIADIAGAINQAVLALVPKRIEAGFLYQWLKANRDWVVETFTQGGQPNLSGAIVKSITIPLPPLNEQKAIADYLSHADDLIGSLERLIAKKRYLKQGMMQELLTGRKRLPGFTSGWRESTIGRLAQVVGGGTPSTRISTYWGGGIPWFTPAEIRKVGSGLVSRSERTITEEGVASSSAHLLPAGSVLVTSRASVGNCAIAACPLATNQGFASMIPRDGRSTWFLYYWAQQNRYELISRAAGSTFLEISASRVSAIPLLEPELDEQAAVGAAIRDTDLELDVLTKRLELVRNIKQGMMQELLTGRTRLPVVEVAV